jgi:hypothetical protein
MEMQLQIWLTEKTDGHFLSGSCKNPPAVWPAHLRPLEELRPDDFGEIKLGLEKIILTLHSLGDTRVAAMATDLQQKHPRLRDIAQIRNNGILAHGTSAVGREGFAKFKTVAAEFFPFDFSCERNPIPPLSSLWLHTD